MPVSPPVRSTSSPKARRRAGSSTAGAGASVAAIGAELDRSTVVEVAAERLDVAVDLRQRLREFVGDRPCGVADARFADEGLEDAPARRVQPVVLARLQIEDYRLVDERPVDDM